MSMGEDSRTIDQAPAATIKQHRQQYRQDRQLHEPTWFLNSAFIRGNHYTEWDPALGRLQAVKLAPTRIQLSINRLQAKVRARTAKFVKNRPKVLVTPGTTEYKDYLNAKATQKLMDYQYRRTGYEAKYKRAVLWAREASRGFIWLHWDPTQMARVQIRNPDGSNTYQSQQLGDVSLEVGSPYEVLVSDPACPNLAEQPEIMRMRLRLVTDMQARYPQYKDQIVGESTHDDVFRYEQLSAAVGAKGYTGDGKKKKSGAEGYTLVTERFVRPTGDKIHGQYQVLVGEVLVKDEVLPYELSDMENPYPVVSYPDMDTAGQFWGPTLCEQLIDLQREYNMIRCKLSEHMRILAFPKLFVAMQHQLPVGAWSADAGQLIEYVAHPDVPPPTPWTPPPIAQDIWQLVSLIAREFDDVSQVFPSSEGKAGGSNSGFQTNLLQEASDSVHAPDIRAHELAMQDLFLKMRRMVKQYYQMERLVAIVGSNYEPEVIAFSGDMIDEFADLSVEAGSALPTYKAAKQDTVMSMFNSGLLGDPTDPETKRQTLTLLELGSVEGMFDRSRTDENQARRENQLIMDGRTDPMTFDPHAWEHHKIHYNLHTDWLKSPEGQAAPPMARRAVIRHTILHARFIDPGSAIKLATQEQILDVIPIIQQDMGPSAAPGPPGAPAPPAGPEMPPPAPVGPVAPPGAPPVSQ